MVTQNSCHRGEILMSFHSFITKRLIPGSSATLRIVHGLLGAVDNSNEGTPWLVHLVKSHSAREVRPVIATGVESVDTSSFNRFLPRGDGVTTTTTQ
jgi:hypothetical protein